MLTRFLDDVEKILKMLPEDRQTMLFSATMPDPIVTLARRFLRQPVTIHAKHDVTASPLTKQVVYRTHPLNKVEVVARILQSEGRGLTMVFCRTKRAADRAAEDLDFRGFAVAAVHGDLGQSARERALRAFRNGKIDVLVATDVAARGLDVSGVTHVINYDCPEDPDTYTHRIGRTGRAGATGLAVTFVDWEDMPRWRIIDKTLGLDMAEPPETYHTSAHLFTDLGIDPAVTGTLPKVGRTRAGLGAEIEEDLGGGRRPRRGGPGDRTGRSDGRGRGAVSGAGREEERPTTTRNRRRTRRVEAADAVSTEDSPTLVGVGEARAPRRRRGGGSSTKPGGITVATVEPNGSAASDAVAAETAIAQRPAGPSPGRRRRSADTLAPTAADEPASTVRPRRRRRRGADGEPETGA